MHVMTRDEFSGYQSIGKKKQRKLDSKFMKKRSGNVEVLYKKVPGGPTYEEWLASQQEV